MKEFNIETINFETFEGKLIKLKDTLVLWDKDVALLYEIEPKKLRQQLKRNIEKFPRDYAFQLSDQSNNMAALIHGYLPKRVYTW